MLSNIWALLIIALKKLISYFKCISSIWRVVSSSRIFPMDFSFLDIKNRSRAEIIFFVVYFNFAIILTRQGFKSKFDYPNNASKWSPIEHVNLNRVKWSLNGLYINLKYLVLNDSIIPGPSQPVRLIAICLCGRLKGPANFRPANISLLTLIRNGQITPSKAEILAAPYWVLPILFLEWQHTAIIQGEQERLELIILNILLRLGEHDRRIPPEETVLIGFDQEDNRAPNVNAIEPACEETVLGGSVLEVELAVEGE